MAGPIAVPRQGSSVLAHKPNSLQSQKRDAFPTVLVTTTDEALAQVFAQGLRDATCLVLEAASEGCAITTVISHSRAIHVLVVDVNTISITFPERVAHYRPDMHVVSVAVDSASTPDGAL